MSQDKCRVCLDGGVMLNIFQKRDSMMISTKIMSLANIQIYPEDGLPNTICRKCLKKLDYCTNFIELCQNSDLKLRTQLVENTIKKPIIEIEIDISSEKYKEELNKFSPKKEIVAENTIQTNPDEDYIKKEVEMAVPKNECNVKDEKKKEKQQCFTCGKVMSSKFRLKTHLMTHTGERPFSCPHCSKRFSLDQHLKVHLRIHTGEKPLSCSECGAKFAQSAGLAAHRRKHTGQMPYRCVLCPRTFRTVGHLQYHIRRHTGEKNFECDTCGRSFITRGDLKQHLVTHSGDKQHVCCICGLRLSRACHLKRHIQYIHHGQKPFSCTQCPLTFSKKTEFEKHKKEHDLILETSCLPTSLAESMEPSLETRLDTSLETRLETDLETSQNSYSK